MKKSTLFELALKITGLIALWHVVQSSPTLITTIGMLSSGAFSYGPSGGFMFFIAAAMVLNIIFPGFFAFLCLIRTRALLNLFRLEEDETLQLTENKQVLFDVTIFFAAILLLISGLTNFISFTTNTNTTTNTSTSFIPQAGETNPTNAVQNTTSTTNSQTRTVNYFAIIQILAGVFFLSNGAKVSKWLMQRYGHDTDLKPLPDQTEFLKE
jgi:K+-sensing histidine kinase KdpD